MNSCTAALPAVMLVLLGLAAELFAASPPGFYVNGRYLYDPCGEKVVLRGANAMVVYWDRLGERIYPELAKTGANSCRIFWSTNEPTPTANELDQTLANCWANNMIPMPSVWMATGNWSRLDECVDYWLSADVLPVLKKHESHLLLNIANEASQNSQSDYGTKYAAVVSRIRTAGLHCPLVIDADGYGRHFQALMQYGPGLVQNDPDHNLIFSWHDWDPSYWGNGSRDSIKSAVDKSVAANICFIVGEFGPCEQCGNCSGTAIEWQYILQYAHQQEIGWLAWVWRWDDCHGIVSTSNDAYGSWANPGWGEAVAVSNTYSIKNTAQRTSYLTTHACNSVPAVRRPMASMRAPNASANSFGIDGKAITGRKAPWGAHQIHLVIVPGQGLKVVEARR